MQTLSHGLGKVELIKAFPRSQRRRNTRALLNVFLEWISKRLLDDASPRIESILVACSLSSGLQRT